MSLLSKKEKKESFYDILDEDDKTFLKIKIKNDSNGEKKIKNQIRIDNMRSKIINHFTLFITNFLNDYVIKLYGFRKVLFTKINYADRKKVDSQSLKELMNKNIKEFCSIKISTKITSLSLYHNLESFNIVKDRFGKDFVNQKLSDFYQNFYLNDSNKLSLFGENITTQNFDSLLKKYENDRVYQRKLLQTANKLNEFIRKKKNKCIDEEKNIDSVFKTKVEEDNLSQVTQNSIIIWPSLSSNEDFSYFEN